MREISIGENIERVELKTDGWEFFKVVIKNQVYKDEDMLIKVIPLDEETDPDVYISKVRSLLVEHNRLRHIQCRLSIVTGNALPMVRTRVRYTTPTSLKAQHFTLVSLAWGMIALFKLEFC